MFAVIYIVGECHHMVGVHRQLVFHKFAAQHRVVFHYIAVVGISSGSAFCSGGCCLGIKSVVISRCVVIGISAPQLHAARHDNRIGACHLFARGVGVFIHRRVLRSIYKSRLIVVSC